MRVANAPCSWGVLEFDHTAKPFPPEQVLDEIAATGYAGSELGEWGFFSTDPNQLHDAFAARGLTLIGAFVPVALLSPCGQGDGVALALRTARLLRVAGAEPPLIILSDATAADRTRRAKAGRIGLSDNLSPAEWNRVAGLAEHIARAVWTESGLRTVFHHHCATHVEAPWEIDAVMQRVSPDLLGLCLDTGHAAYGGGDPLALLSRYGDRVWHVHFKDCSAPVAARARSEEWDYVKAVRHGLFCELGRGVVDFPAVLDRLRCRGYDGWIVVEQDVVPSTGTPAASAERNRLFLGSLGV